MKEFQQERLTEMQQEEQSQVGNSKKKKIKDFNSYKQFELGL